jgi:hypothetical protein
MLWNDFPDQAKIVGIRINALLANVKKWPRIPVPFAIANNDQIAFAQELRMFTVFRCRKPHCQVLRQIRFSSTYWCHHCLFGMNSLREVRLVQHSLKLTLWQNFPTFLHNCRHFFLFCACAKERTLPAWLETRCMYAMRNTRWLDANSLVTWCGENFDAASTLAPSLLNTKRTFLKQAKVNIWVRVRQFFLLISTDLKWYKSEQEKLENVIICDIFDNPLITNSRFGAGASEPTPEPHHVSAPALLKWCASLRCWLQLRNTALVPHVVWIQMTSWILPEPG